MLELVYEGNERDISFTMQNYNKYFNVASDINIFLIIVYFFFKKQPSAIGLMVNDAILLFGLLRDRGRSSDRAFPGRRSVACSVRSNDFVSDEVRDVVPSVRRADV